jgi:hypothetical protein
MKQGLMLTRCLPVVKKADAVSLDPIDVEL